MATKTQYASLPFRDFLLEGEAKTSKKERVNLIGKGLARIELEEGNMLLPVVTIDDGYIKEYLAHGRTP